jgi:hypothetical protein
MKTNETPSIKTENKTYNPTLELIKYLMALLVLAFYFGIIAFVAYKVDGSAGKEIEWSRYLYLIAGIEAIVFVAVGFVFGKDVARKAQQNAENIANTSQQTASQAINEKEQAQQKTQDIKKSLISLAEAVIAEQNMRQSSAETLAATGQDQSPTSRAHQLALKVSENL